MPIKSQTNITVILTPSDNKPVINPVVVSNPANTLPPPIRTPYSTPLQPNLDSLNKSSYISQPQSPPNYQQPQIAPSQTIRPNFNNYSSNQPLKQTSSKKGVIVVFILGLIIGAIGIIYSQIKPKDYIAETYFLVRENSDPKIVTKKIFETDFKKEVLASDGIKKTNFENEKFAKTVEISSIGKTNIIYLRVTDTNKDQASLLLKSILTKLRQTKFDDNTEPLVYISESIYDTGRIIKEKDTPDIWLIISIGFLSGVVFCSVLFLLQRNSKE